MNISIKIKCLWDESNYKNKKNIKKVCTGFSVKHYKIVYSWNTFTFGPDTKRVEEVGNITGLSNL